MHESTRNADPAELAKFAALAQSWWDPKGPSRPLHDLNPLRLQYIEHVAALPGKPVLDVGCGGGILSEAMARAGARVLGVDLSQAVLDVAELHALESKGPREYRLGPPGKVGQKPPPALPFGACTGTLETAPRPAAPLP